VSPIGLVDAPAYQYPKIRYGTPAITRAFVQAAVTYAPTETAERGENRAYGGRTEYLFSRIEEACQVDFICQPDELAQLRWFFEDHAAKGKQFELWIDRHTGSVWGFEDTLRDQNALLLVLNSGSAAYAAATNGRGLVLGAAQSLSVATAQASAATPTGFDDPLLKDEGILVVEVAPTWAGTDGLLHRLVDTSGTTANRLSLYKTAGNLLIFEILDAAGGAKNKQGAVTWAANTRVRIVASWSAAGALALWYATGTGAFTELTTAGGAGTGIITTLGATLYIGSDNAAANFAPGTYDTVAIFKRAFAAPLTLADYRPTWRNYYPYAELTARQYQPQRLLPSTPIYRWPLVIRNGLAP
jgi:hypothetical protein